MKLCPKCQQQFSSEANFCPVDATRLEPLPDAPESDSLSTRFELGAKIGGARTGAVHRATDKTTGHPVAVKLVASGVVTPSGSVQRLERELHQLERIGGVGLAKIIASGKRGDEAWFAMELLEGARTLADAVGQSGPIAAPRAAEIMEAIGTALIEAAQAGVVHRDLAPKNVLLVGNDVKLINFALPVPADKVPGVPEFVAPEQVDGRPVDQRSNLYSLGALYYYMLTGHTVFEGAPAAVHELHRSGTIRPPSQVAPTVTAAGSPLEATILRALDRSPTKRFLTVRQFVDEVTRVGKGAAQPPGPSRPPGDVASTLMGVSESTSQQQRSSAPPAKAVGPAQTVLGMASAMIHPPSSSVAPVVVAPVSAAPAAAGPVSVASVSVAPASAAPASAAPASAAPASTAPAAVGSGAIAPLPVSIGPSSVAPTAAAPTAAAPLAPVAASTKPQAQVVTAPALSTPLAAAPAGKRKSVEDDAAKGKFRETMWFKKGDLDTQAAILAADERSRTGKDADGDKVDSMPIDERYKDDGSLTRGDKERYSLRTGATQTLQALRPEGTDSHMNVSPDALIGEMKGGRTKIIVGVVAALIAVVLIIVFAAR